MWDGLGMLLVLSTIMAVASFAAGLVPLSFSFSPRQMRFLTAFGIGVLVGTSLIVIIPEGVETLYSAKPGGHSHTRRDLSIVGELGRQWQLADITQVERRHLGTGPKAHVVEVRVEHSGTTFTGPDDGTPLSPTEAMEEGALARPDQDLSGEEEVADDFEPHAWIGVSVILGFILMYLIDRLPKLVASASRIQPSYISLDRLGFNRRPSETAQDIDGDEQHPPTDDAAFRPSSTTTGLVIHAAADGIALGATSTGSSRSLGFVVFIALMIHKAPAAFGLTAALLKQGLTRRRARTHLIVFSLAAPLGAMATWAIAQSVGGGPADETRTNFATGLLLLFSGGTFLYVAMHAMQEVGHSHESANGSAMNGYADPFQEQPQKTEGSTLAETLVSVGGMLLPLLTQIGHAH